MCRYLQTKICSFFLWIINIFGILEQFVTEYYTWRLDIAQNLCDFFNFSCLTFWAKNVPIPLALYTTVIVRVKESENLWDFSPLTLTERKVNCRFLTVLKRQMGRSGVMACSSVTCENKKFYETLTNNLLFLDGVTLEIAKKWRYVVKVLHEMVVW